MCNVKYSIRAGQKTLARPGRHKNISQEKIHILCHVSKLITNKPTIVQLQDFFPRGENLTPYICIQHRQPNSLSFSQVLIRKSKNMKNISSCSQGTKTYGLSEKEVY